MKKRIYLSPPHLGECELELVKEAFASNWIAPLGPQIDAFEKEFREFLDMPAAVALSSGTAALHLALRLVGVSEGDDVLCSTLTFIASAGPIRYLGAHPAFIDSERQSWNLDPELLAEELKARAGRNRLPRAVVAVDALGQSANYDPLLDACAAYDVAVVEDAAEALGATYQGRKVGAFGSCAAFSFNGNKIMTASGGGMLVSHNSELIEKARFLSQQARDPAPHYQHSTIGYNYRMSNILAAIGRGQLKVLDERIRSRRAILRRYREGLGHLPGIEFMPEAPYGRSTRWLSCITIDGQTFGADREEVRLALEAANIESRPLWKPLHLQPVFASCPIRGGAVAEDLFARGLCLPSGSQMSDTEIAQVIEIILRQCRC